MSGSGAPTPCSPSLTPPIKHRKQATYLPPVAWHLRCFVMPSVRGFHRGILDARRLGRPRDDGRFFFWGPGVFELQRVSGAGSGFFFSGAGFSSSKGPSSWLSSFHAPSRHTKTLVTIADFSVFDGSRYHEILVTTFAIS